MEIGKKAVRNLGKRIKQLRDEKQWTQADLASLLGVEQTYISGIERGEYSPSFSRLARLAQIFELTISELCEGV